MDIEFHYYIIKGIALRAGFNDEDSEIMAHASQLTDDNVRQYCINRERPDEFKNYISFTYDILKPRKTLIHIYPIFHFIPGDPDAPSADRIDGIKNRFNTTPDSRNAKHILKMAFDTGNLYRIGIALHGFADTWAHQNFTGLMDEYNAIRGFPGDDTFKNNYKKKSWCVFQTEIKKHQDDVYRILESLFETTGQKNNWIE